jgi:thiosulfate/3-mercaptopyruvate sulfurtransferase
MVPALPGPLVDGPWLAAHAADVVAGRLVVADVRWYLDGRSGRAAHEAGHLPGAVWVDVDTDLSAPPSPATGRHPLPSPDAFAAAMGRLGIGDDIPVVAYDDGSGSVAARLWWLLHVLDHPVAVLDGGVAAYPAPLEAGAVAPRPARFTARSWPSSRMVDADELLRRQASGSVVLDARATPRYEQGDPAIDPRPGHVPGARSAPWAGNVDGATGRLRSAPALRQRFAALGVDDATAVVAYCGSGVTACHDLLALEVAGLGARSALYPGSWSQWGADAARPAETGPDPLAAS